MLKAKLGRLEDVSRLLKKKGDPNTDPQDRLSTAAKALIHPNDLETSIRVQSKKARRRGELSNRNVTIDEGND